MLDIKFIRENKEIVAAAAKKKLIGLVRDANTVHDMFWMAVRRAFPEAEEQSLGMRKDWKVVIVPSDTHAGFGLPPGAIELPGGIIAVPMMGGGGAPPPAALLKAISGVLGHIHDGGSGPERERPTRPPGFSAS